jgi:hypothetical protein
LLPSAQVRCGVPVVILVSCIAVMVVTTLRGVHLIYSHDTGLIGVTEWAR